MRDLLKKIISYTPPNSAWIEYIIEDSDGETDNRSDHLETILVMLSKLTGNETIRINYYDKANYIIDDYTSIENLKWVNHA